MLSILLEANINSLRRDIAQFVAFLVYLARPFCINAEGHRGVAGVTHSAGEHVTLLREKAYWSKPTILR